MRNLVYYLALAPMLSLITFVVVVQFIRNLIEHPVSTLVSVAAGVLFLWGWSRLAREGR